MADKLEIATFEQIAVILSHLMTNYNALADNYYKIFYDTTPADITITLYNDEGELTSYTLPNRAKDFNYIKNGNGNPEGSIVGAVGSIYQDLSNGKLYIKQTGTGRDGWTEVPINTNIEEGYGSPNGNLIKPKGTLYIDKDSASMYIKSTNSGSTGWNLIAIDASNFANTDLSNLTMTGENHFANLSLSNLNSYGQDVLNAKASVDLDNLSSAGEAVLNKKASIDLDNLSELGQLRFTELEEAINQRATQNLGNLDLSGNIKFQCTPFSINGGATDVDGANITLQTVGDSTISVDKYVVPQLNSNTSDYGNTNDYKLTQSTIPITWNSYTSCVNPWTMGLAEEFHIPENAQIEFTIDTNNIGQQINYYGNLGYRVRSCTGCKLTLIGTDDNEYVVLDEKNTGHFSGWNTPGAHSATVSLTLDLPSGVKVKGISIEFYKGNLGYSPVVLGYHYAWNITFRAIYSESSTSVLIIKPCTITTADSRTKVFEYESTLDFNDYTKYAADTTYNVFKSYADGSISVSESLKIQKTEPSNKQDGDYWLDTSKVPYTLKIFSLSSSGATWVPTNDKVLLGTVKVIAADEPNELKIEAPKNRQFNSFYNSVMAKIPMPSNKFEPLELQTTGSQYTAPDNGYFVATASVLKGGYVRMYNSSNNVGASLINTTTTAAYDSLDMFLPVKKGDKVTLDYTSTAANVTISTFGFVLAAGEEEDVYVSRV